MRRPGTMGLNATLRAAHYGRRLGNVQLLPVTQEKSLALTHWQALQLFFYYFNSLRLLQLSGRRGAQRGEFLGVEGFQRVDVLVLAAGGQRRQQRSPQRPHFLAP